MAIKIPPSLKLSQLKSLAFQCGISTSGTKTVLTNRITDELIPIYPSDGSRQPPGNRILSIDMGIRNLAYCILDIPSDAFLNKKSARPTLISWRRIAVSSAPISAGGLEIPVPIPREAFDPQTMSITAYGLLRHTLLLFNPAYILIERQRFRSMGSPHILEWTIRVNMLESMLYAVLQTLKSENIWNGTVISVAPGKVGPFWLESEKDIAAPSRNLKKLRSAKSAKLLNKGAKIDLVQSWLKMEGKLTLGTPEARSTAEAYLEKWYRVPGRTRSKSITGSIQTAQVEVMGKLDDLADSLLQGMAWIQWEKNKQDVIENGIEELNLDKRRI